jgi:hypothetical protein
LISIRIFDNEEWQPDLEFTVVLYDPETQEAYEEYDTVTRIKILDEDFPGTLGFTQTSLSVQSNREFVELTVKREDGSDGKISCMVRTEEPKKTQSLTMAVEHEHYIPINKRIEFLNGE